MMEALSTEVLPLNVIVAQRRATQGFRSDPIPTHVLKELLELSLLAPSGYNLQPWRLILVQDKDNKRRLREAAMNQAKVEEAPVVIIVCAHPNSWTTDLDKMLALSKAHGAITDDDTAQSLKSSAEKYLSSIDNKLWATKQTMILFTQLMLLAETYGLDTAPMEGFSESKVKELFSIPEDHLVLALLAIGYAGKDDKPFAGRFDLSDLVSSENFGQPLVFEE
ncbi:MAG: nitroreductase family protein [Candidatus Obscuribacterales bacterium]|nr:nitroreductase family protein [Candidatus Obscuribacterales bacterium]